MEDLDSLYTSENLDDIKRFYQMFKNREELVTWMKNRPSAKIETVVIKGESEKVAAVIPTAYPHDERVKNLIKSLHRYLIILSVSSGKYFNFARSVNEGVMRALELDAKWIIISNDDVIIKSKFSLGKLPDDVYSIFIYGKGEPNVVCKFNFLIHFLEVMDRQKYSVFRKFRINYFTTLKSPLSSAICRKMYEVKNIKFVGPFFIVNSCFVKNNGNKLFDPVYINGVEDFDFLTTVLKKGKIITIKADVEDLGGATLQNTSARVWRNYANYAYFNYKIEHNELVVPKLKLDGSKELEEI